MRIAKLLFWLWLVGFLVIWARGSSRFSVLETLPNVRRQHELSSDYDGLAVAMVFLCAWGYARLKKRR